MPFTFAHPAAALPLHGVLGRAGILSALVVGSLSPDFGYFVPLGLSRVESHSLAGLFWFCVPAGLLAYGLFHLLLRPVVAYLLPAPVRDRLPPLPETFGLPVAPVWAVLLSLGLGAATHLLWDACTHADGFVVKAQPALHVLLWEVGGYRVFVYKVLQHGSTLLGLVLLALWIRRWFMATSPHRASLGWHPPEAVRMPALFALLAGSILGGCVSGILHMGDTSDIRALQQFVGHGVITAISVFGATLLGFGVVWRLWEARATRIAS